jgi:hypothetical protein
MTIAIDRTNGKVIGQHVPAPWGGPEPIGHLRLLAPNHPNANAEGIVYVRADSVRVEEVR